MAIGKQRMVGGATLEEDLKGLGVKGMDTSLLATLGGQILAEAAKGKCATKDEDPLADDEPAEELEGGEPEDDEEEYDEAREDPIDGRWVSHALFDRILALPFANLSEDQLDALIEELKEKRIPASKPDLQERAQEVAQRLLDEKRRVAVVKGKRTIQNINTSGAANRERRERRRKARRQRSKLKLQRLKRGRRASSKMAAAKTARTKERLGLVNSTEFASELESMLGEERNLSLRADLLERIDRIVDLLGDEFLDEAVDEVFDGVLESLDASYHGGRLDEAVMNDDQFLAEIRPAIQLISKSLDKLERSGN